MNITEGGHGGWKTWWKCVEEDLAGLGVDEEVAHDTDRWRLAIKYLTLVKMKK